MSKERELLEALKHSTEADTAGLASTAEGAYGAVNGSGAAAQTLSLPGNWDPVSLMNVFTDVTSSMLADPLFYLKAVAVLIVAVTVVFYAVDLIFGG